MAPPLVVPAAAAALGAAQPQQHFELYAHSGRLHASNSPDDEVHIKGVTWSGLDGGTNRRPGYAVPRGLTAAGGHSVAELLDALESEGFNTVRLPITLLSVLANPKLSDESLQNSPAIYKKPYVDAVDAIATLAARRGLMVVLAASRLAPEDVPHNPLQRMPHGLWWSEHVAGAFNGYEFPKSRVIEAWQKLAAATCNHWNVVGVDLMEGLSAATWGAHALTDWNLAAAEIGDAVLKACPRWLILVRGIGAAGAPADAGLPFTGSNLAGAVAAPVVLRDPRKLVYVARVRGPALGQPRPWFSGTQLPATLKVQWGRVPEHTGTPVLAALATSGDGADATFAEDVLLYLQRKKQGVIFDELGPHSEGGRGPFRGVMDASWVAADPWVRDLLGSLPSTSVGHLWAPPPPPPPPPPPDAEGATLLACYAKNNEDLLAGFCGGVIADCRWDALGLHWEQHGRDEGRTWGCGELPPPPPPPPPPTTTTTTTLKLIPHHVTPSDHETPAAAADDAPPAADLTATVAAAQRGATRALTTIFGTISPVVAATAAAALCVLLLACRWRRRRRRWQRVQSDQEPTNASDEWGVYETDSRVAYRQQLSSDAARELGYDGGAEARAESGETYAL